MIELMYDQFKIKNKIQLNNSDIDALTKLYVPLLGIDSYALYFSMASLDEDKDYNFKSLLDVLNFKSLNSIDKALAKLEGMGLVKTFKNNDNNYLFELIRPLNFNEFLKEEALCALLASCITEAEVDKLKERYLKKYFGYKEITKKFEDVFETKTSDDLSFIKSLVPKTFEIENKNFNYALFKMLFDTSFITEECLEDSRLKADVLRLSYVYKLDEEAMHDCVISAFSMDKDLNYASIAKYAKLTYRDKNENDSPVLATKFDDDYLASIKDDEVLALCTRLEDMSPAEVLEYYNQGKASAAEIAMFDKISNDTKTPIPVVNLMIVYSVVTKEGEIPGYSYFEKIASTWKRAGIKNVYDAVKYMSKKAIEREEKLSKSKGKKEVKVPEWYNAYKKEIDKKDNDKLNDANALDILEAAKGLFGDDDE